MTDDELKQKIKWTKVPDEDRGGETIYARLVFKVAYRMDPVAMCLYPQIMKERIKEEMTERLMSMIYEDRRAELHAACRELFMVQPHDTAAFHQAVERILTIAKRQ